jgi:protocatechuate 3,4-dioxygenase, beta subunit
MKAAAHLASVALLLTAGCGANGSIANSSAKPTQARPDLYQCEGCEGALEADATKLSSHARIAPLGESGEPMRINGIVYASDGKTTAKDIVIYAYQTNAVGLYAGGTLETEASRRHGRLRAWTKTDEKGRYSFDTIKPAPYPNDIIPAHIHFTIREPGKPPYWIDDIVFDGEFGVTDAYRRSMTNKGGNGIVKLARETDGTWVAVRDVILEEHPE